MSTAEEGQDAAQLAVLFSALGDTTRLGIVTRLLDDRALSISTLSAESSLTRQAVTKHLQVLEHAGIVTRHRVGRQAQYSLRPEAIRDARRYLEDVSRQWDEAIDRLKAHLEEPGQAGGRGPE
jgi:DNA-binding transcriptional ArsR family regulator